ncbi:efflux RND transporter periplasmic adaptor subunit [Shewanella sp. Isolate11]|uniref:efflux RND transporter periplasmic adaptor subunit n=1 Tax=Shewanella sp. Isolate11 TaxID=2908530 RepID=UPI001EFD5F7B|nr:efflux RND transporter periplasmic adaptor subunit [Shewanella sp. Isolate11]MCG9698214.1 efflux RND transporter periplasmic adaptor subunit [Shewanella sp. Isolate11]
MKKFIKLKAIFACFKSFFTLLFMLLFLQPWSVWAGNDHDHSDDGATPQIRQDTDNHDEQISLTAAQQKLADIQLLTVSKQMFSLDAVATATLTVDRDRTITLAPQLDVRVLKRYVVPGQEVSQGQALLTLGGAAVAQAQADYINAAAEWGRIQRMSKSTVSDSHRLQTQVNAELTRATLQALKMTSEQIKALESAPETIGSYQLLAPIAGRVQQDVAMLGQVFNGGTALMQLTDESHLWIEAQLTPMQAEKVKLGSDALVKVGQHTLKAQVIGRSHELDSLTRTEKVLLAFANPGHVLHAGQFAEIFLADDSLEGTVLPDAALTRGGDGDWQVFIEEEQGFSAREVQVIQRRRGMNLVQGLDPNMQVVVSGAFFLASEQAKSGFDIHNH